MPEEQTYKGKTLEELKRLTVDELAEIMPSHARRSLKRGMTHEQKRLLQRVRQEDRVKTHARDMIILPEMVGKTIEVYNGEEFKPVEIEFEMLGHYLGEFAFTRKEVEHSAPGIGATRSSKYIPLK